MRCNAAGRALIERFEGCRLEAYRDAAGVLTIGYGHTGSDVIEGRRITRGEADDLLAQDLVNTEAELARAITVPVTANQFSACCALAYNIGVGAFRNSTLLRRLNDGDAVAASSEFPRWNHAGSRVLAGLTRRREAERLLFIAPDGSEKKNGGQIPMAPDISED